MALAVLHKMKRYHAVVQVTLLLIPAMSSVAEVPGVSRVSGKLRVLVATTLPPLPEIHLINITAIQVWMSLWTRCTTNTMYYSSLDNICKYCGSVGWQYVPGGE